MLHLQSKLVISMSSNCMSFSEYSVQHMWGHGVLPAVAEFACVLYARNDVTFG